MAQAAPKTGDTDASGEIVVTATRRAAPRRTNARHSYNVSAIGGARIDPNQTRDQAERQIPGVAVVDRGRRNASTLNTVTIRGINVDSSALGDYSVSSVAPVSTYVNDTPLFAQFLLKDLDRVEVLRGPQGTLYGSGSMGGTIRYILNKPVLGEWQGRATAGASYANGSASVGYEGDLVVNIPIRKTIAIRAVGSRQDYPGITDYPNVYNTGADGLPVAPGGNPFAPIDKTNPSATFHRVKDADYVRVWYGRVAALWQSTDTVDPTLTYNHQSDHVGGRRQVTRSVERFGRPYGQYENGSVQLEPSSRLVDSVALEANVDFGFATLTPSTSYYDHEGSSISENTGFYAKAGFLNFYYNYPRPIESAVRIYKDRSFIEEVRLVSKAGHSFDYVIGGYYDSQKLLSTQGSFLRGYKRYADAAFGPGIVGTDQDFLYRRHKAFEDRAAFGELTWHITDKVQVKGGGRYINNSSNNDTRIAIPVYVATSAATVANFPNGDDRGLFKANASWKFARDNPATSPSTRDSAVADRTRCRPSAVTPKARPSSAMVRIASSTTKSARRAA